MALVTINGFNVIRSHVTLPRTGRWVAEFVVDAEDASELSGELEVQLGSKLKLIGTAKRSGPYLQKVKIQAVGGAGGLLKLLQPKAYQGVPLRIPLSDALAEVGESLSADADPNVLDTVLPFWTRMAMELGEELRGLTRAAPAGTTGRILPDGSFWMGVETWPTQDIGDFNLIDDHRGQGEVLCGIEEPQLLPGTTFLDRRVQEVIYEIDSNRVRMNVQFVPDATDDEPQPLTMAADLDYVVQKQLKRARYMGAYPARVVQQNGDLSLELELDSEDVPGLSNVPLRAFAPGAVVKVAPNSRVTVVFENGDPQHPVAVQWDAGAGSATNVEVHASVQAALVAPAVMLGSTEAVEPLVLGATWKTSEDSYDLTFYAACQALQTILVPPSGPPPTTVAELVAALTVFIGVIGGAPQTPVPAPTSAIGKRLLDRLEELSAVSKTL